MVDIFLSYGREIIASFLALTLADTLTVASVAGLESILSVDNAVVLTVLTKDLPTEEEKKRALHIGMWFAYVVRFLAIFVAGPLLAFSPVKYVAAAYLLYVGVGGLLAKADKHDSMDEGGAIARIAGALGLSVFVRTVVAVEFTDVVFSLDSIAAALAFSSKLAVVFLGGLIGIAAMRYAAQHFGKLIKRYPVLEKTAFLLVAFIGLKLVAHAGAFPGVGPVTLFSLDFEMPETTGAAITFGVFFGALGIAHFFPNSRIARIGRKEAAEIEDEAVLLSRK